jgi:hypothetical protein
MLSKKDLELIGEVVNKSIDLKVPPIVREIVSKVVPPIVREIVHEIVDTEFGEFAILMQREFAIIHKILETKADTASKEDIIRLEGHFGGHENRICLLEDSNRIIKTKLKMS